MSITPPFPMAETSEGLTILVAKTFAYTPTPQGKLKGSAWRVEMGIVQLAAVNTAVLAPLQLVSSVLKVMLSLC